MLQVRLLRLQLPRLLRLQLQVRFLRLQQRLPRLQLQVRLIRLQLPMLGSMILCMVFSLMEPHFNILVLLPGQLGFRMGCKLRFRLLWHRRRGRCS